MGIGLLWCSMGEEGEEGLVKSTTYFFVGCYCSTVAEWTKERQKNINSGLFCKWYICTLGWLETTKYKIQKRETPISVPFLICSLRFFLILSLSVSRPIGCCSCRLGRHCKLKRTFYLCFFLLLFYSMPL